MQSNPFSKEQTPLPNGGDAYLEEIIMTFETINDFIEYYKGKSYMVDKGFYHKQTYFNIGDPNPKAKEFIFYIFNKHLLNHSKQCKLKLRSIQSKYGFQLQPDLYSIHGRNNQPLPTTLHYHYNFYMEFDTKKIAGIRKLKKEIRMLCNALSVDYCVWFTHKDVSFDAVFGYN